MLRFWSRRPGVRTGARDVAGLPEPDTTLHPVGGVSSERGANQLRLLRHCGMQPTAQVLEIGCGVGRLAYELASYLDDRGSYTGFDISPKAIGWLNEHYAPRLPGFRFDLVDARNVRYRPGRGEEAASIRFPYDDRAFDVVGAFAVFMHMQLPEIANYCDELARVLKPEGFGVVTFRSISAGEQPPRTRDRDWVPVGEGVYSIFPETPGRALAYDDALVRTTIERAGLEIASAIEGRWHARPPASADAPTLGADAYVVQRRAPA
jgi:SAM-dependent methyltransferase